MLRLATHVLVNSDAIAARLAHTRAARSGRLCVIPNGVDLSRFGPAEGATPRPAGLVVGTLANLRPEKGLHELVEAAALVKSRIAGVSFAIWGEGPLPAPSRATAVSVCDALLAVGVFHETA